MMQETLANQMHTLKCLKNQIEESHSKGKLNKQQSSTHDMLIKRLEEVEVGATLFKK